MPRVDIVRAIPIERTPRVMQLEGIFDVTPAERSEVRWQVELPIEQKEWSIGLVVGPSGCGKSTLARELFGDALVTRYSWPEERSIVDAFPAGVPIRDITMLLSSVGFSSPPSWVRPFHVLSTGEQFRTTVARAIAENPDKLFAIDEFTSVVDRTVAQIGSCAIAKTVRRRRQKFVAVSCHRDIIDWLQPDWTYDPSTDTFQWRELQRRPPIRLAINRVHPSTWRIFSKHHYLTATLHRAARCFVAFVDQSPVAFHSYLPAVGFPNTWRGHRSVTLPDYQGAGIGNALITYLAGMWAGLGARVLRITGHPAEIASAKRSPQWRMIRKPSMTGKDVGGKVRQHATTRLTASFEYAGAALPREQAEECMYSWARHAA